MSGTQIIGAVLLVWAVVSGVIWRHEMKHWF